MHFSASLRTIGQDIEIYKKILYTLRQQGCSIANDWVESAWFYTQNESKAKLKRDWNFFNKQAEMGIESADVAVIEGSGFSSFGVGYEAGYAAKIKKPTLILIKKEQADVSYASGLNSDIVSVRTYTPDDLERIINRFLKDNEVSNKDMRFNFVIDRQIYNHLRIKSFNTGKTKAEIVRDIVLEDMKDREQ